MKHINIIITTLFLTTIAFAVTVDGNAFLDGQTDHSGVTITFVRTAPSSLTETATTDASGYYTAELETGVYDVAYTKDNYFSTSLMGRSLWSSTTLSNITLTKRITQLNVPSKIDYKIDHIVAKENERLSNIQLTSNSSSIFWVEPRIREDYQPVEVLFTERSVREWCGTMPWWESRNSGQRSCDLYGATDDPTVRDSYIPNTNTDVKYFRLYIHAFADNNGDNPTSTLANAEAQLLTLNEAFLDYKIQFTALFQIHNDSQYQSIGSADWSAGVFKALYAEDPTTYHNLYVMDTDANWSILGVSTFPWDSEAITSYGGTIIDKDWFGGPRTFNGAVNIPQHTITHELGHALGLWHTHHGVDEVTSCGSCYEGADGYTYATGNDANVVGDLCSDTKATPTNFTCADPTGVDCQSNFWVNTDVHNFMGYADDDCYDLSNDGFSSQQSGRVHGWITDKYEGLVSSSNQRILLSASFEDGIPSDWTIADNDADGNAWFAGTETTSFDLAYFGVKGMVISYNASGNDDWLITPEITIPQNSVSPTFKFWARSHHPSLLEDFIVRISTNGSNFSSLGATYSASSVWTQYSYDLSSYAGESIYLALQCVSVDEYYLFADDFLVSTNLSPLEANFSANPVSGNAALITNFTDISGGSPTSWSWDFGDGNTSSTQHPTHNYESPGAYTVSLTISDGIDSDTETKSDYINVTAPLEGIFTESFENYSDFEINSIGDWTIIDNDGGSTWGLSDVIYPNVGYVGSGIIFNPSQTTPSTLGTNLDTYSGSKGLYFFASGSGGTTTPNDDWMITPQIDLTGVSNTIFSFWAKSFTANYGLERIQVAISNTGTNEADFSVISSENYIEIPTSYTQFIYDLSAWDNQEIYIGIHYVTDNAFLLQMDEFIVNGNINDNPVLASIGNQSTNEDMAKVVTLSATDVESDGLTFTAASAETNVTATVDGTSLTLTPADDWNGTADITVIVTDDGTGTLTDSETFTLTVNPINDNPVLTSIGSQTTNEDTAKVVTLSATDIENDDLTYSVSSAESNVTATVSDNTLTLTPADDWNGTAEITVFVNDGFLSDTTSFVLTVTPVNDAPEIMLPDSMEFSEDGLLTIDFTPYLNDIDSDTSLGLTASGNNHIDVAIESFMVTYTADTNWNGFEDIVFTIDDQNLRFTDSDTVRVNVLAVNDAPVITALDSVSIDEDNVATVNLSATDIENDDLTYSVSSAESNVTATVSNDTLTLTPSENWNGTADITVFVNDGFLSDTSSFVLTVNPVNDAPVVIDMNVELEEDGNIEILLTGSDIDGDDLTISVINAPVNGTYADSIYTPNLNFTGTDSLSYLANDGFLNSDTGTVFITVTNTNDAPYVLQPIDDVIVDEDSDTLSLLIDGVFDDLDIIHGDSLSITAQSLNTDLITIASDSNMVPIMVFALNANGETDVIVMATDLAGLSVNDTIHVTVNAVNDEPVSFSLLSPNWDTIVLTNENLSDTLWFEWDASMDVDGDSLSYLFKLSDETNVMIIEHATSSQVFGVEYSFFVEIIDTLYWNVMVSAGMDTLGAENGPFTLIIEGELAIDPMDLIPNVFALHQNYPNPFNPVTTINYDLPEQAHVSIMIYDIMGRKVKRLINQAQNAGYKSVIWDATNDLGQPVSAGMYLYRIQTDRFSKTMKMVLLK